MHSARSLNIRLSGLTFFLSLWALTSFSQTDIREYLIYGGGDSLPPVTGVYLGGGNGIPENAVIGSSSRIQSFGPLEGFFLLNSWGTIELADNTNIQQNILAADVNNLADTAFRAGENCVFGNIDVNGNARIASGLVNGVIRLTGTYVGPEPNNGIGNNPLLFPQPTLPSLRNIPPAGAASFTNTAVIQPGAYNNINLAFQQEITFDGPGTYIFNSINCQGNNNFRFNFQGGEGVFIILIHGDVNVANLTSISENLSPSEQEFDRSPERIYFEIHGNGSAPFANGNAFTFINGAESAVWQGGVYAPNGRIRAGVAQGSGLIKGYLWGGKKVTIDEGVNFQFFQQNICPSLDAEAGEAATLTCNSPEVVLQGYTSATDVNLQWAGPGIVANGNTLTPTVNLAGTYYFYVSNIDNTCLASDSVFVTDYTTAPDGEIQIISNTSILTCSDESVILQGVSSNETATFSWSVPINDGPNETSLDNPLFVNFAGDYTLTITDPNNGCTTTRTITIGSDVETPSVTIISSGNLTCDTTQITLEASVDGGSDFIYEWTSEVTTIEGGFGQILTVDAPDIYTVFVRNPSNQCSSSASIQVTQTPCIVPYFDAPDSGKTANIIGAELTFFSTVPSIDDTSKIFYTANDSIWIDVICNEGFYDYVHDLLITSDYGLTNILDNGDNNLILTGRYPMENLAKLNLLSQYINYVRPVYHPISSSGLVTTKGDQSIKADLIRGGYTLTGAGVKVGVLSNSFNTQPGGMASIDLINDDLSSVEVLKEFSRGVASDEGRAMLQIVHDVAPDAQLGFRTGFLSAGDFAKGIRQMADANYDVIVDDITYITEPFFQDGPVAEAANYAYGKGVAYFTAAGNYGSKSYGSEFFSTPAPGILTGQEAHDFSNGSGDVYQNITLTSGTYLLVLQWEDSVYSIGQTSLGTQNDLDIYLAYNNGSTLFGFNRINTGGDPFEVLPFTVTSSSANVNIMVTRASGTGAVRFKYVFFRGEPTFNNYNSSGSSTITGQANAEGVMTVGTVNAQLTPAFGVNNPVAEYYSSQGGTYTNGAIRQKPDFCGPDAVKTTVPTMGPLASDGFAVFFGTSAAAPHVAAAAALLIEAGIKYTGDTLNPDEIRTLFSDNAYDMNTAGFDYSSGYGLVDLDKTIRTFASPVAEITEVIIPTGVTPGDETLNVVIRGNYLTAGSVVYFNGLPLTTQYVNDSTLEVVIYPFTGNPPLTIYNQPISSSLTDGGFSEPYYFFGDELKTVEIIAQPATKKFGEKFPFFTAKVKVDGEYIENTNYQLSDLGISTIDFICNATSVFDNTGQYAIKPSIDTANLDQQYKDQFTYVFTNGILTISKMKVIVEVKDTTIEYGSKIGPFEYAYDYDSTNINSADAVTFLYKLDSTYKAPQTDVLALIDATINVNGRVVTSVDFQKLSMIASGRVVTSSTKLASGRVVTSGQVNTFVIDTTKIASISPKSLFDLIDSVPNIVLESPLDGSSSKALINGRVVTSSSVLVNGRVVTSSPALANSALSESDPDNNIAIILDSLDINNNDPEVVIDETYPINIITGKTVGNWDIVPAAFVSSNFEVEYALGKLNITPAELKVEAVDTTFTYGETPAYRSVISGLKYDETEAQVVSAGPVYTITDLSSNTVSGNLNAGQYLIKPSVTLASTNYTVNPVDGDLTISPAPLTVKANDTTFVYGTTPGYKITLTGLKYSDTQSDVIASGPTYSVTTTGGSPVSGNLNAGSYIITPAVMLTDPTNYSLQPIQQGNLTISKATLTVRAEDKTIQQGQALPAWTFAYTGFQYSDNESTVSAYRSASTSASSSSPAGQYPITVTVLTHPNYILSPVNGTLFITGAPANCTIVTPTYTPVCGLTGYVLRSNATNAVSYKWTVSNPDWIITAGATGANVTFTAGTTSPVTFTLEVTDASGGKSNCRIVLTNTCVQYCAYGQGFYGGLGGNTCSGMTTTNFVNSLLSTSLTMGDSLRKITFGTNEGSCLITKLPSGSTSNTLPVANVSCAQAVGNNYLKSGKFINNLLGQNIALSLSVRSNPALGDLRITGPFITTFASTSCSGGKAVPGTKRVSSIPQSVVTFLGANNKVSDLIRLANRALGGTYVPTRTTPSLSDINNAVMNITAAFDRCRIFVGFSSTSAGIRLGEDIIEEDEIVAFETMSVTVFPNPTNGISNVMFTATSHSNATVELVGLDGRVFVNAFSGNVEADHTYAVEIDCHNLPAGIYFIRVIEGDKSSITKLINMK